MTDRRELLDRRNGNSCIYLTVLVEETGYLRYNRK